MLWNQAARRPDGRLILAALAGALTTVGCAGPAPAPSYRDLVTEGTLISSIAGGGAEPVNCGFETRFARTLRPGEVLTAEIALGRLPRLAVSACRRGGEEPDAAPEGELAVSVSDGDGGPTVTAVWPFGGEGEWWRRRLDLEALAGRRVTVRLEARFPGPRRLFLEELVVEHVTPASARRGDAAQVLLISADTLRADAVGAFGGRASTPALDRLAADGEAFAPHYAAAGWTKPSHAEMLTGYGPGVHRVLGGDDEIDAAVPTLAERFGAAGFTTAGLVFDCVWLDSKFGFGRGFESYRSEQWGVEQQTRTAANWMAMHRDRPFFYFLHLFDAHSDYHVLPYEGPRSTPEVVERRFGVPGYGCREGHCASNLLVAINDGLIEPLPAEAEILRFLYDRGVERLDAALGRLFHDLAVAGIYDDLLIAFTSDHGEAFLEHGVVTHGHDWEEVLQVPLIVKWPRGERAGTVRRMPSGSGDLAATLLAAAGIDAGDLPGTDLRRRRADRPVFAGTHDRVVIVGSLKAIFPLADGEAPQLRDLAADPAEHRDVAAARPSDLARLRELLTARTEVERRTRARLTAAARVPEEDGTGPPTLTEEDRSRLRALGYLDGGG